MSAPRVGDLYVVDCNPTKGDRGQFTLPVTGVTKLNSGGHRLHFDRPGPRFEACCASVALVVDASGEVARQAGWPDDANSYPVRESAPAPDVHVSYVPGEDPQTAALREMVNGNRELLGIDGEGGGEER